MIFAMNHHKSVGVIEVKKYSIQFLIIGKGIANPGLQALWDGERTRRMKLNITDRLTPPTSPGIKILDKMISLIYIELTFIERPRTNPFAAEIRHQEKLKTNIEKR